MAEGKYAIARTGDVTFKVRRATKNYLGTFTSGEGRVRVYEGSGRILLIHALLALSDVYRAWMLSRLSLPDNQLALSTRKPVMQYVIWPGAAALLIIVIFSSEPGSGRCVVPVLVDEHFQGRAHHRDVRAGMIRMGSCRVGESSFQDRPEFSTGDTI